MIINRFIKYLYLNLKYTRILMKVYKEENLLENLSDLYGSRFRMDWLGRLYSVINPYISNGQYDPSNASYEYDVHGLTNDTFIKHWIMTRMIIAEKFIQTSNLFDIITFDIQDLGNNNYLFIMKPIYFDKCVNYTKKFCILLAILLIIITIAIFLV